ncbi:MAG: phosphatase PAP2 family protein [archaeon]
MKRKDVILVFVLVFLALFFMTMVIFSTCSSQQLDNAVDAYFSGFSNSFLIKMSLAFSLIFDLINIILISLVLFLFLFFRKLKEDSFFLLSNSLLAGLLIFLFREIIQRPRPENLFEFGFGFPSGHVTIAVVFFCSLIYLSFKHIKNKYKYLVSVFSVFLIFLIIFSRIYLRVHWFSDILGGFFLGGFIFLFNLYFFEKIK